MPIFSWWRRWRKRKTSTEVERPADGSIDDTIDRDLYYQPIPLIEPLPVTPSRRSAKPAGQRHGGGASHSGTGARKAPAYLAANPPHATSTATFAPLLGASQAAA